MEKQNMEQNANPAAIQETGEKTFTQEQVNAIVGKRLAEAKASSESALNKREAELNQREMQIRAKELLEERGLPKGLAKVLKYDDEESLKEAINVIEHTRGFRDNEQIDQKNKQSHWGVIPQPLPISDIGDDDNPIREAMRLNRKD